MLLHSTVLGVQRQQHLHLVKLALLRVGGGGGERHQRQRRALLGVLRARGGGGHGAGLHALRHGFALCQVALGVPLTPRAENPKKARLPSPVGRKRQEHQCPADSHEKRRTPPEIR